MTKSVIVIGLPGCGKTRFSKELLKHFGLTNLMDGYDHGPIPPEDTLVLTNWLDEQPDLPVVRFEDVIEKITK